MSPLHAKNTEKMSLNLLFSMEKHFISAIIKHQNSTILSRDALIWYCINATKLTIVFSVCYLPPFYAPICLQNKTSHLSVLLFLIFRQALTSKLWIMSIPAENIVFKCLIANANGYTKNAWKWLMAF